MSDPFASPAGGNLSGVRKFDAGRPVSAGALNRIAEGQNAARTMSASGEWQTGPYGSFVSGGRSRRTASASTSTPFRVIPASTTVNGVTTLKVRVSPGTVYVSVAPTIGGTSIFATPAPTLATTESGFVVLRATWPDDFVPRCSPSSVVVEFEAGDPDADYVPPVDDTRTSSRMAIGRVWVADGAITRVFSELTRNVVMERQIYNAGDSDVKFIAFGR